MSSLTWFRLHPKSGFHFGEQRFDQEDSRLTFPSDSLYAALLSTAALVAGRPMADQFATALQSEQPPVRLTSLFPFAGDLPLFPLPTLHADFGNAEVERKFTKKVQFVSPAVLQTILNGKTLESVYYRSAADGGEHGTDGAYMQEKAVWLTWKERDKLPAALRQSRKNENLRAKIAAAAVWQKDTLSRVRVDRLTNQSQIFRVAKVSFAPECGLWVGMTWRDAVWKERVIDWLHHLGDAGIGAERSSGYGGFVVEEMTDAPLSFETAGERRLLLSRFVPNSAELPHLQTNAAYQLVRVGGWRQAPNARTLRRKTITLVEAGSVLGGDVSGRVVNVAPEWGSNDVPPVYRAGLALTIPCK